MSKVHVGCDEERQRRGGRVEANGRYVLSLRVMLRSLPCGEQGEERSLLIQQRAYLFCSPFFLSFLPLNLSASSYCTMRQTEERARRRLKQMLSRSRSASPPTLPHLRESPPPMTAPYAPPATEHTSYAAFVLDPAMTHSYRTHLLADLQHTTENLIQGEAMLNRAFGRLWKVLSEEENVRKSGPEEQAKREDAENEEEEMTERERRIARAPELAQPIHKLFLTPFPNGGTPILEPSHFGSPQMQLENMEKNLATLRELQDDSREYVERLEEIREGLGDVRRQRDFLWMKIRENALVELEDLNEKDTETTNGEL